MNQANLKKLVVYYSEDGNTKLMAETIAKEINGELLELQLENDKKRSGFSRYFFGGMEACFGKKPRLKSFDKKIADYDIIYIGTPVWAGRPVPAVNSFLSRAGLHGKNIALFCTFGGDTGGTFKKMKKILDGNNFIGELGSAEPKRRADKEKQDKIRAWAVETLQKVK